MATGGQTVAFRGRPSQPSRRDRRRGGDALSRLVDAGVPVLNQAVLLRGVNDRADVLAELCQRLVDLRVMPYYLHQLDPVAGAAHFKCRWRPASP